MIRIACVLALLVIIPSAAWALFGHGRTIQTVGAVHAGAHPISIAPTSSTIIDTAPAGTPIATLSVGTSDGSAFVGSLSVTEGTGIVCSVSPCSVTKNLVSARQLTSTDNGMHTLQIAATENGQTFTQAFTLNVFGLTLTVNPASPSIPATTAAGATVAQMTAAWSNGATFTGTEIFAAPNYDNAATYSISSNNLIVSTTGPGVGSAGGATQNVSLQAVQIAASPDGTISNAPNGPPLANSAGVWFWEGSAASAGRSGENFLEASNAGTIVAGTPGNIGILMEVANGGQLYINTASQGWFVWNGTTFVSTTGPIIMPAYNDASANWKHAGLLDLGGIPNRTTACATVNPTGITPPASGDDAATIQAAISACPDGDVLPLAAGTFQIAQSEHIWINGNITLRGAGSPTNNCSTGATTPCWPTNINVYDGAIANWTISATTGGTHCGVNVGSAATCTAASGVILMSPSNNFNWGWTGSAGQCNLGATPTSCGTPLTADSAAGTNSVTVGSTAGLSVGGWVLIDENPQVSSTTNPTGGAAVQASSDWLSGSGSPVTMKLEGGDIPNAFSLNPNRVNAELHLVTAISGSTVTFDDPLTMAFRQSGSHDARIYSPTIQSSTTANPFLDQAGVENLTITRPGNGGIQIEFCSHCWVKNVEVGGWISGAVNLIYAARSQLEGNYFHDCFDCENNGTEYPVGISNASTESYVDNNIIVRGGKGMVGRAAGANVVAYNYVDDTFYMQAVIGDYWEDMGVNGSHYAGAHSWLFEGNWGSNCDNDETHGNNIYHVYFRNYCTGLRVTFTDPSIPATVNDAAGIAYATPHGSCVSPCANPPGFLRTAGPMAFNYWHAYVGNILGTAGQTTTANGWTYRCYPPTSSQINKCIWGSGWVGSEWPAADPNLDGVTNTWLFRHGNYDYVNGSIADWQTGYSQGLPSSLFLTAAPAFFTAQSCTWPWIDSPSVTISKLPAQRRFSAGTPFVPVSGC